MAAVYEKIIKYIDAHIKEEISINEIADTLKLSYSGVNFHIKNLYMKLGIHSRTELYVKLGSRNEN